MDVPSLVPTPYHRRTADVLRKAEPSAWQWFASDRFSTEYVDSVRLELLKATYRLDPASHADIYGAAQTAAVRLGLTVPIILYQAQGPSNAGLCFVPGVAHIVLTGNVTARLTQAELIALFGHELAHYDLWTRDDGVFRVADALIESNVAHHGVPASWVQQALRHRRYTEIYADRGSLVATQGILEPVLACLLKVSSDIERPDVAAYLAQVDEVLGASPTASEGTTHPELFIRAWAIRRWLENPNGADADLAALIEGPAHHETLDVVGQHSVTEATRSLIASFLDRLGNHNESVIAAAREFFPEVDRDRSASPFGSQPESLHPYFSYVLLDLATADPDGRDEILSAALGHAKSLGFEPSFASIVRSELRMKVGDIEELRTRGPR